MNIPEIKALAAYLRDLPPEKFDMSNYFNECGTAACLAGWQYARHHQMLRYRDDDDFFWNGISRFQLGEFYTTSSAIVDFAQTSLGLDWDVAHSLFQPKGFYNNEADGASYTPLRAAAVLENLVTENLVQWDHYDEQGKRVKS